MKVRISFMAAVLVFMSVSLAANAKDITVVVKGMVCGFCAQGIEKKFKALPEVKTVVVSLENKTVKVSTKENQDVSDVKIGEILKEAGYNVESIQR